MWNKVKEMAIRYAKEELARKESNQEKLKKEQSPTQQLLAKEEEATQEHKNMLLEELGELQKQKTSLSKSISLLLPLETQLSELTKERDQLKKTKDELQDNVKNTQNSILDYQNDNQHSLYSKNRLNN